MIPTSIQYFVLSYIIIQIANYLQLQKHYIKYSTYHSYYVVAILHIFINNFIYKNQKNQINRTTMTRIK